MEKENMFLNQIHQNGINELNCSDFWDRSGGDLFESALSSVVSSPTASNNVGNGGNIVFGGLMGRLGSICNDNHGEVSINNTSCYSSPLNSPPKLNLLHHQIRGNMNLQSQQYLAASLPSPSQFSTDPGFAERAARFSCFAKNNPGGFGSGHHQSLKIRGSHQQGKNQDEQISASDKKVNSGNGNEFGDSRENSTVSVQIPVGESAHNDSKKRKANARVKGKENSTQARDVQLENSETSSKRIKSENTCSIENEKDKKSDANDKKSKDNSKPTEPPKDYIHVRARRGQATDAHSLAERFRREKISERMKFLQDLVPGCNKVTGKAVMLDEIINYVQSLQRQVEFLSMKLATVNPRMDFNIEGALASKEMFQSRGGSFQHNPRASDYHHFQARANPYDALNNGTESFIHVNSFNAGLDRTQTTHCLDNFSSRETVSQVSTFWEDDLHSVVQMGIAQNQIRCFDDLLMKVEQ